MAAEVEIWFLSAPPPAAVGLALERYGNLVELRDGELRLVPMPDTGEDDPRGGVPFWLLEDADAPDGVRALLPDARAVLRASAVLTGPRGFWMSRIAAELQRRLGGVVFVPSSGEAYATVDAFEASWPGLQGGHD